jgi:hypothetical protein
VESLHSFGLVVAYEECGGLLMSPDKLDDAGSIFMDCCYDPFIGLLGRMANLWDT